MDFDWKIAGHDGALESLESDMRTGELSHAYLFAGPDGVGKFIAAKRMARFLQCKSGGCGKCSDCKEIDNNCHADTVQIFDNGGSAKIEEIRKVMEKLNLTKNCKYKILLMQSIERMTVESANALLKTLEDPPENVIFLLTTDRIKEVMATILSRVRIVRFKRLANDDIKKLVRAYSPFVEEKKLETICRFAMGRPGKALTLLDNRDLFALYEKLFADIGTFLDNPDKADQFTYVAELVKLSKDNDDSRAIREFLDVFQIAVRARLKTLAEDAVFPLDKEKNDFMKIVRITVILEQIQKSLELLGRNVNNRLLLENLMLTL